MDNKWQQAFGRMTNGIYVLTTRYGDQINAMIASWVTQVSYDPPLILAAVHPNRYCHDLVEKSAAFALHIIARDQTEMIERMMGPDPSAKFDGLQWEADTNGCPRLEACLAWFACRVNAIHRPGNHTLFIGEVVDAGINAQGKPMRTLDYEGKYTGNG